MRLIDIILKKDKSKKFYEFLEKNKVRYLTKFLRRIGIKKRKIKYFRTVDNIFNLKEYSLTKNSKEIIASESKKLNRSIYQVELFNKGINFFFIYDTKGQKIVDNKFFITIKYLQENMKKLENCNYGIFVYGKNVYAITKKIHNSITTFVEVINKKYEPKN